MTGAYGDFDDPPPKPPPKPKPDEKKPPDEHKHASPAPPPPAPEPNSWAKVDDVAHRMGKAFAKDEVQRVTTLLEDAEIVLFSRCPWLEDMDPDEDENMIARVVMVESNMVARVLRNPGGYRSESAEGYSYTVDTRAASGFLLVLKEEMDLVGAATVGTVAPEHRPVPLPGWARTRPGWRRGRRNTAWIDGN